ncbi:MAG: hypothetical protein WB507_08900 [Solirubrobacterales bacterium]
MSNDHASAHEPEPVSGLFSDRLRITPRGIQVTLGLIWLLDGLLQFQSFMYTHNLITQVFQPAAEGQPGIVSAPMKTFDNFYGSDLALWNTLAGEIQCAIGLGLILTRKTVKPALLISFCWAFVVWWLGEGFGGITAYTTSSPLMGAPGAVFLYAIIGVLVWPTSREAKRSAADSGPLGDRGGLIAWTGLWVLSAILWMLNDNRAKSATHDMIAEMASASPHWLASIQNSVASSAQGQGETIAVVLAIVSLTVAIGVWTRFRLPALLVGIVISLAYWVFGQSLGGPFWAGGGTDVNSGPLFVLFAAALIPLSKPTPAKRRAAAAGPQIRGQAMA